MIFVLIGPPGVGKGTQADILVRELKMKKISTGDALRHQIRLGTQAGLHAEAYIRDGKLVPDSTLLEVLEEELKACGTEKVLLDGYPRNIEQAKTLEKLHDRFPLTSVIHLDVENDVLYKRLIGRKICEKCGTSFHDSFKPPKVDAVCDLCGAALITRPDDSPDKIKTRLEVYSRETMPVLDFYKKAGIYLKVNGNQSEDQVSADLKAAASL